MAPGRTWSGWFFDGRTAQRIPVVVHVASDGLTLVEPDGHARHWPYSQVRQTQGGESGEHARFEFGVELPQVLVVPDPGVLAAVAAAAPEVQRRFRRSVSTRRWAAVTLLILIALPLFGWAVYAWIVPALADAIAGRLPLSVEEELGETVVGQIAPQSRRCSNERAATGINEILAVLHSGSAASPYRYRVMVINEMAPNGFAAPGGYIVLTQGLLNLAQRPEDLAGILAHEIQHVEQRHGTRLLIRELSFGALIGLVTGDARGVGSALNAARTLGTLRYRRADELAADEAGVQMLRSARIDPQGLISMLQRLKDAVGDLPGPLTYLSTHPSADERIVRLRRFVQASDGWVPLALSVPWPLIVQFCRT
jgi:Zn-dependent protease with chaperone function